MPDELAFNPWQSKPWWCQPWTIILTGIVMVSGSWWLFKSFWLTVPLFVLISLWWFYFLILYPRLLRAEVSKKSL